MNLPELHSNEFLPIIDELYTIQGEGYHTGKPAYFIRIGGCDIGCNWCDTKISWNPDIHKKVSIDEIVEKAKTYKTNDIVVTGGEPTMHNLDLFCAKLKKNNFTTYLETAGNHKLTGIWDWICLSPKEKSPPLNEIYLKANELKVIIFNKEDIEWAEEVSEKVGKKCKLYLQAEWSKFNSITPFIVDYVKNNIKWSISIQAHKFMKIP